MSISSRYCHIHLKNQRKEYMTAPVSVHYKQTPDVCSVPCWPSEASAKCREPLSSPLEGVTSGKFLHLHLILLRTCLHHEIKSSLSFFSLAGLTEIKQLHLAALFVLRPAKLCCELLVTLSSHFGMWDSKENPRLKWQVSGSMCVAEWLQQSLAGCA